MLTLLTISLALSASSIHQAAAGSPSAESPQAPAVEAPPALPAPAPELMPLAFMSGAWVMHQPRGAIIEEHWMPPRGNSMLGSFRRILGNGAVAFYEFTQIVVEEGEVILRQRHLHRKLDIDPRRGEPMVLRLAAVEGRSATFVPVDDPEVARAGSLERVTYALGEDDMLTLRVLEKARAAPEGGEAPPPQVLEFRMRRLD